MPLQPDAILQLGGIRATANPLKVYPGTGFHVVDQGEAVGSHWVDTRTTGALASDYSQFRYARAGVTKYRHGVNLDGTSGDDWTLRREGYAGDATEREFLKFTRLTGRADFYGPVYAAGVQLTGGVTNPLIPANDTASAFTIRNASNTLDFVRTYGDGRGKFGTPLAAITALGIRESYSLELYSRTLNSAFGDAKILIVSNQGGQSTQWSSNAHVGEIGSSADGGVRLSVNSYSRASDGAFVGYESARPRSDLGMDSASAFSYRYTQPSVLGVGAYSATASQTFVIYGQGRTSTAYEETDTVSLMTMQGGRSMELCACAVTNTPLPVLNVDSLQHTNLYGRLGWTASVGAQAPIRFPTTAAPSIGNNDLWFDGSNLLFRLAGVTKTLSWT